MHLPRRSFFFAPYVWRRLSFGYVGQGLCSLLLVMGASPGFGQGDNFRIGQMRFDLRSEAGLEYNSNLGRSGDRATSDVIAQVGLDLRGAWDLTEINQLTLRIGARYDKYFNNSELDSSRNFLILSPDTELAFQLQVGNFSFRIFDRLTFSQDPGEQRFVDPSTGNTVGDVIAYNRFDNTLGINGLWDINPFWQAGGGLRRRDVVPIDSEFDFLRLTEHRLNLSLTHLLAANMRLGLFGTVSDVSYRENFQPDGQTYAGGVFAHWEPTAFLEVESQVGYFTGKFDREGLSQDRSDPSGMNGSLLFRNYLRSDFEHSLAFSRDFSLGTVSNTVRVEDVAYRIAYSGFERSSVDGGVNYTRGRESGGISPERYNRWTFRLGTGYALSTQLTFRVSYRYTTNDSNLPIRDYNQHVTSLRFQYDF